jgi:hypothetical protein
MMIFSLVVDAFVPTISSYGLISFSSFLLISVIMKEFIYEMGNL